MCRGEGGEAEEPLVGARQSSVSDAGAGAGGGRARSAEAADLWERDDGPAPPPGPAPSTTLHRRAVRTQEAPATVCRDRQRPSTGSENCNMKTRRETALWLWEVFYRDM